MEFATELVFKRNSGCLKKYGGGSSLPRIYGMGIGAVRDNTGGTTSQPDSQSTPVQPRRNGTLNHAG